MDDRDHICPFFGHVDQISANSVWELDCINDSIRTNYIWNMGDSCSWSSTQVQDFGSWEDSCVGNTSENWCSNFGTERVPYSVFDFLTIDLNTDTFLIIDTLAGDKIFSHHCVLRAPSNVYSGQSMRLNEDLGSTSGGTSSGSTPPTTSTTSSTISSSASSSVSSSIFVVEFTHS